MTLSVKQVGMRSRACEDDLLANDPIDQQPIGLEVALATAHVLSFELMIVEPRIQTDLLDEHLHHRNEQTDVFIHAALPAPGPS